MFFIFYYFFFIIFYFIFFFFFFSSRRRHTRWTGDWSSDVCSSDLIARRRSNSPRPRARGFSSRRGGTKQSSARRGTSRCASSGRCGWRGCGGSSPGCTRRRNRRRCGEWRGSCCSEAPPHPRLQLPRVAQARPDSAVEVEEQAAVRGVLEVVRVRQVEDLDDGLELPLRPEIQGPRDPDVPREERVVLAERVPRQHAAVRAVPVGRRGRPLAPGRRERAERARAAAHRRGLRRVVAHAVVEKNVTREPRQEPAVDAVTLIPVAPVILGREVVGTGI